MENVLKTEKNKEIEEVVKFLKEMTSEEKKELLIFMQGIYFSRKWKENC